jgi:hypothetical protein
MVEVRITAMPVAPGARGEQHDVEERVVARRQRSGCHHASLSTLTAPIATFTPGPHVDVQGCHGSTLNLCRTFTICNLETTDRDYRQSQLATRRIDSSSKVGHAFRNT